MSDSESDRGLPSGITKGQPKASPGLIRLDYPSPRDTRGRALISPCPWFEGGWYCQERGARALRVEGGPLPLALALSSVLEADSLSGTTLATVTTRL